MNATAATYRPSNALAAFWIIAGVIAGVVSFLLYQEYIGQLNGAEPLISCDISPFITCGPNLLSPAGNLLGFTNAILGMVLFFGPIYAGVSALAAPNGMRAWYWRVYAIFVLGGFVLVHVFAYRSIFQFGSLCPWCMIVWLMTIPLFWSVLVWTMRAGVWGSGPMRLGSAMTKWVALIVLINYVVIGVAAELRLDVISSLV